MTTNQINFCEKCSKIENNQYNTAANYWISPYGCDYCIHPKCRCRYSNGNNIDPNCCFNKHKQTIQTIDHNFTAPQSKIQSDVIKLQTFNFNINHETIISVNNNKKYNIKKNDS